MYRFRLIPLSLTLLAVVGCGPADSPRASDPPELAPALSVPADSLVMTPAGLWTYDRAEGEGAPAEPGDLVTVHYTGWLTTGARFDGSTPQRPFSFTLGAGEVISGWDEGVAGMRPGGSRILVIPPQHAYGERGVGVLIPPNSTLVFEVELLEARSLR
jgi:FKBP-type peptidyl-prolyl cis-trans isomerase FkpA